MIAKSLGSNSASVTLAANLLGGMSFARPAAAAVYNAHSVYGVHAQLETDPPNGSASRIWLWVPNFGPITRGKIVYEFTDGKQLELYLAKGTSRAVNSLKEIKRVQACDVYFDGHEWAHCSAWAGR